MFLVSAKREFVCLLFRRKERNRNVSFETPAAELQRNVSINFLYQRTLTIRNILTIWSNLSVSKDPDPGECIHVWQTEKKKHSIADRHLIDLTLTLALLLAAGQRLFILFEASAFEGSLKFGILADYTCHLV